MRRPIKKSVDFRKSYEGYVAGFFADGAHIVDVFFDRIEKSENPALKKDCFFYLGSEIVMVEDISLYDLFCEFRKQDEAPEVLTVDGADSSSQCTQGGAA
ncbi:hypothetical protein Q5V23_000370 [Vibrio fluvialis]|nr:hypothetical protein [Vibrio fluvialis]